MLMHRWAGHVSRLDAGRVVKAVLGYRDLAWWTAQQAVGARNWRLQFRHPGRYRDWRWERRIFQFYYAKGFEWRQRAASRDLWQFLEKKFANVPSDWQTNVNHRTLAITAGV